MALLPGPLEYFNVRFITGLYVELFQKQNINKHVSILVMVIEVVNHFIFARIFFFNVKNCRPFTIVVSKQGKFFALRLEVSLGIRNMSFD